MQYIGIDMSKDTFHVCFDDGTVMVFTNSISGIRKFLKELAKRKCTTADSMIGTEATW